MADPKVTLQKRIIAHEGISLQTIQKKGSDGQKIAAPLFDYDDNGKLEGKEVTNFNNHRFKAETDTKTGTNTLTISRWVEAKNGTHVNMYDGEKHLDRTTVIKYNSLDELYYHATHKSSGYSYLSTNAIEDKYGNYTLNFTFKNGSRLHLTSPYERAEIDMTKNKAVIYNMQQKKYDTENIFSDNMDLTVKNSDIDNLIMVDGKLKLENTYPYGSFDNRPIEIATNGVDKVKVQKDAHSRAKVFTWNEIAD